ncbi:M23 family metallopeptidase [Flavobacterium psychrotolerans]|uniref:M23 family peptidase n=1 Tax=Flavobacterium psychrotolerans TaxID=2169410 RepID=A0A2U1JKK9_9FLAO|nr:M23 family metallopeptidase [Flavobacterium psychrotolerans]PWA05423.1 M23 family peptidase [Flavobacterium psychrotolerans]
MKLTCLFLFFYVGIVAQTDYPKGYFRSPLDISMQLSGNFGELRPNHFHAGFDFRTMQKEGLNVYAVADGYVSRIKISTFGNGKAIYITHPNGYTSVYGHLQKGVDKIEAYIKKQHYKDQAYEIEMFPNPNELLVKKGEIIALSGNTGGSEGPHLHFEFRDSQTEKVINPYFFGFDSLMKDTKKPQIASVLVYPMDDSSVVNQSRRPMTVNLSLQNDGSYLSQTVLAKGKIGFGIQAYDLFDYSYDKYGIFKVQTFLNGSPSFGYQFDTFSFDETKYINAFIDYYKYKKTKQRIQKLFMKNPFPLSIIHTNNDNGIVTVSSNFTDLYRIEIADYYGNSTVVSIPIQFSANEPIIEEEIIKTKYFVRAKTDSNFEKENCSVFFPAGTFYDDFYMNFEVKDKVMTVHNNLVPVNNSFLVTIIDSTATNDEKTFIASVNEKKMSYNATKKKENTFTAYTKNLGQFTLAKDTVAPKITMDKPIEGKWITNQKTIQLTISDFLSGIKSYNGYLNGKWILFEYENKTKTITHYFDDGIVAEGENDLKVVVTDNVGNSTIFETHFFRSQKK